MVTRHVISRFQLCVFATTATFVCDVHSELQFVDARHELFCFVSLEGLHRSMLFLIGLQYTDGETGERFEI